eukprot:COSAG04_NODE_4570_length_2013_cov_1.584639_1_plen_199_part_10
MPKLDAAALRARVREAGAGRLVLYDHMVTCSSAELAGALAAEGAGLTGLSLTGIKLGADGWRAVFEALRKGACPQLTEMKISGDETYDAEVHADMKTAVAAGCPRLASLDVPYLDAAALRARVREAGAGELELYGPGNGPDPDSFGGAELAVALAAEGAGLTGLTLFSIKLGADGWRAVLEALRKGACPRLAEMKISGD